MKPFAALLLCLVFCAPTPAAPPPKAAPERTAPGAAPPALSAAEQAYAMKFRTHARKMSAILLHLASLCQSPQPGDAGWKRKMTTTVAEMRAGAETGRKLPVPPRFRRVQRLYSSGMIQYEDIGKGMSAAVAAGDARAFQRSADRMEEAGNTIEHAATLLGTLEQKR